MTDARELAALVPMRDLLERAGFRVRSAECGDTNPSPAEE